MITIQQAFRYRREFNGILSIFRSCATRNGMLSISKPKLLSLRFLCWSYKRGCSYLYPRQMDEDVFSINREDFGECHVWLSILF